MNEEFPKILGKFNYHTYKQGLFNLMFVPFEGAAATIVARDLDEYSVRKLMGGFNRGLERHAHLSDRDDEEIVE